MGTQPNEARLVGVCCSKCGFKIDLTQGAKA